MDFNIPGLDRGTVVAAFAGAVAYLCVEEKMPALRAAAYVVAGGVTAAYLGPGMIEALYEHYNIDLKEKTRYAFVFATGVCGIWILHILTALARGLRDRSGIVVSRWVDKIFGTAPPQQPPPHVPAPTSEEERTQR